MTIKTWHDRIMELEDGVIVTELHVTRYMQAEIDELRAKLAEHKAARIAYASEFPLDAGGEPDVGSIHANIRKLKKDAERFNFLCDCENEQALDLLANHVGHREDLIELVDELIKEKS